MNTELKAMIRLKVMDIDLFDRNPRSVTNEKFVDIKDAIRARGLEGVLSVTKRPGAHRYMIARGGNTRLQALWELYEETGDPKYGELDFLLVPYEGELKLLTAHVSENSNRGGLVWWDNARIFLQMKSEMEKTAGKLLSLRAFSEALKEEGLNVSPATLSQYQFTLDTLHPLGEAAPKLSRTDVTDCIQPAVGKLSLLAAKLGLSNDLIRTSVFHPALEFARIHYVETGKLDVSDLIEALHARFAKAANIERTDINELKQIIERIPDASPKALRKALKAAQQRPLRPPTLPTKDTILSADSLPALKPNCLPAVSLPTTTESPKAFAIGNASQPLTGTSSSLPMQDSVLSSSPYYGVKPQQALLTAVRAFAQACAISGLVETETLPLWFMVDIPRPQEGESQLGEYQRSRYYGWW